MQDVIDGRFTKSSKKTEEHLYFHLRKLVNTF